MISPQTALVINRLCFDASAIVVYGSLGFMIWAAPRRLRFELAASYDRPLTAFALLSLLATLVWPPLETATIGESWSSAVDGSTMSALLFGTAIGKAWLARFILSLSLVGARLFRLAAPVQIAVSALLLASLALTGHARMDQCLFGVLHMANDVAHLLSGGAWLGSLVLVASCVGRLRDPVLGTEARSALRRFSVAGHFAVALVMLTGIVNTALILKVWPTGYWSIYQTLLGIKIVLVLAMASLALINRYVFVSRMKASPDLTISQIRRATVAELGLGFGVLAMVAIFGTLDPA